MAKKFVPGFVGASDAAGAYKAARDFYTYLMASEKEADALLVRANEQLTIALESKSGLVHHATEVQEAALEMSFRIRELRVESLGEYTQKIGELLAIVQKARAGVDDAAMEDALAQFDLDLSRLQQRYDEVYAPFYGLSGGGDIVMPNVREWGHLDWATFHVRIEGPVLLWKTISECADKWGVPGVPPCHGPDYLRAWVLVNQADVMLESYAYALGAVADALYDFTYNVAEFTGETLATIGDGIVLAGSQVVAGVTKGLAKGLGGWIPVLIAGGVVAWAVKTRKKK